MNSIDLTDISAMKDQEKLYDDPKKLLEFTQKLLEKQLNLTKSAEEKCENLRKKNINLECQNDVTRAKLELMNKENSVRDKAGRINLSDIYLEEDMLKAQISSAILKAVVTPLEEEIDALKKRLAEAEARLSVSYVRAITTFPEVPFDENSTTDIGDTTGVQDGAMTARVMELEIFNSELKKKLGDSEVYVVALSRQKDFYEQELKALQNQLQDVRDRLAEEEAKSAELKQTWEKANEQFILESLNYQAELKKIKDSKTHNITLEVSKSYNSDVSKSTESISTNEDSENSEKIISLQSELELLKLELEKCKQRYKELDESVPVTLQDSLDQLNNSQNDFKNLDTFLFSIQEEFANLLSRLDMNTEIGKDGDNKQSLGANLRSPSPNYSDDTDLISMN